MTGIGVILLFLLFVILKVPIAISMGIPSFLYIYSHGISITAVSHRMVNSLNSVPLLAVPLFILAGNLMNTSGISDRIFRSARIFVGRMKGGLAQVNVLASLIFSGISGAALADVGGLGNVEIRAMREQGYPDEQSAAITAASATIGPIFPPSIPLIIFGTVAEVSGIRLLIAGIVPALIITVFLMLEVAWLARKYEWPRDTLPLTWKDRFKILGSSFPALLAPVILILGLVSGTFSPTELAGFAVFYMIIINILFYHEVSWKSFISTVRETLISTANILFIVSAAAIFAWVLTVEQLPVTISNLFLYITDNPYLLLLLVNVLLFIVGMFMESIAAILVFAPLIVPPLINLGVDPVHLGIVMVLNLMIGLITPPVGMSLYMISIVSQVPVPKVTKAILPYYIPLVLSLLVVTFVPCISTFLPNLVFGK
ncbi:MAG TPA: TRAP transporter large permease [Spirochaetales bacterium]|nr:TRAP transporter large permease [Spirochaetales bacterium]